MKILILLTTALLLLVQSFGYGQVKTDETNSIKQDTILKEQNTTVEIDTTKRGDFIGVYILAEADFDLEIVQDKGKMYIISPFSKDILIQKNKTTLHEPIRGVDLELIENDKSALKYTQNGYETTIRRKE